MESVSTASNLERNSFADNGRNTNNNSNRPSSVNTKGQNELGEIHPETTTEGYGLRTPYNTHFNLDFLQYCKEIEQGPTYPDYKPYRYKRSSASSQRMSRNSSDPKISDVSEKNSASESTSSETSNNLFETRRRLDAFRSFRKRRSMASTENLGSSASLESQESGRLSPGMGNATSAPASQQNLQVVRQQMAAALTRLKYLENEVKQIPVLQVQISVLQQEKQKLNLELKSVREEKRSASPGHITANGIANLKSIITNGTAHPNLNVPPPPPRRKYKSVAVGDDTVNEPSVEKTDVGCNTEIPTVMKQHVAVQYSIMTKDTASDAMQLRDNTCVSTSTSDLTVPPKLQSKQTSTDEVTRTEASTTSADLIHHQDAACGHPQLHYESSHSMTDPSMFAKPCISKSTSMEKITNSDKHTSSRDLVSNVEVGCGHPQLSYESSHSMTDPTMFAKPNVSRSTSMENITNSDKHTSSNDLVLYADVGCGHPLLEYASSHSMTDPEMISNPKISKSTSTEIIALSDKNTSSCDLIARSSVACGSERSMSRCDVEIMTNVSITKDTFVSKFTSTEIIPVSNSYTSCEDLFSFSDACCGNDFQTQHSDVQTMTNIEVTDASSQMDPPQSHNKSTLTENRFIIKFLDDYVDTGTGEESVFPEPGPTLTDSCTNTIEAKVENTAVNTESIQQCDKSTLSAPESREFSCHVKIQPSTSSIALNTEILQLESTHMNTEVVQTTDSTTQDDVIRAEAFSQADIRPPSKDVPTNTRSIETRDVESQYFEESPVKPETIEKPEMVDESTDTDDLSFEQEPSELLEIGAYVGQVETLLEEQQSLYKELEGVKDHKEFVEPKFSTPVKEETTKHESPTFTKGISRLSEDVKDDGRYQLSPELLSSCMTFDQHLKNSEDITKAELESAMLILQHEWFSLAALPESNPQTIKEFVSEVYEISPLILKIVVNMMDSSGNSALHYAISHKNFGLVCTLLEIECLDVDQFNNAGYTACMLAAIMLVESDFELHVLGLLFQKADVNLHAKQAGQTALMLAVTHGCVPIAKLLLNAGADINAQDEDGSTALMCATEHGHIDVVKLLLAQSKCDPNITDNDGSMAINIAMETGQRDIGVLLYTRLKLGHD